ncbi:hypothetical protein ACLB1T_28215 [Escherichia coli]
MNLGASLPGKLLRPGKCHPAKVMVIGAGVAGLAAIGASETVSARLCVH